MKKSKVLLILLVVMLLTCLVVLLVLMNIGTIPSVFKNNSRSARSLKVIEPIVEPVNEGKIDDWCYEPQEVYEESFGITNSKSFGIATDSVASAGAVASSEATLGYSVGGSKDITNFRENIENGYFPLETDITYEGVYYDYSFDTGNKNQELSDKMFYPTYSTAISKDPVSNESEYYVSVGLNSNIKESDFTRKKLNLMLVLDISGSMSSSIDNYYYDFDESEKEYKSKMQLANESINILLDQLKEDDSVGIVLFDNGGYLAKPLNLVENTDIEAIKEHVLEINAMGGTNFEAGINLANEQFEEYGIKDTNEYENRMIIITDAMPNVGVTSSSNLRKMLDDNSKNGIYTSFIGVGVDFNSEVVKNITDIRGANYYSVSSEDDFKTRMGEEFEYMVTPLVFDLNMDIEAEGFEVVNIYGTDSADAEAGNIMHINTLFPSKTNSDGEVKGGIILLKIKRTEENLNSLKLNISYETRDGQKDESSQEVEFTNNDEYYDNTGIRKGVLLSRYVNLIKNWTKYERTEDDRFLITPIVGIFDYYETENSKKDDNLSYYSENERTSVKLTISEDYKNIFNIFKEYMEKEIKEIGDSSLNQEIEILNKIMNFVLE